VGALLHVLARAVGATRILEIGTAIGYSGIWLARALPANGMLLTMEKDPERARVARANFERAGLASRIGVIVGDAQVTIAKVSGPFDLIFQDGSKPLYATLLDTLVDFLRPRGLLVTDNVLWDGKVVPGFAAASKRFDAAAASEPSDADTRAIAEYNQRLNAHPDLITATVPLRDGVAISVKK
jgi:predicted O-methyltransferase YrrM